MKDNRFGRRLAFIILLIVSMIWVFPLLWAIGTSFKSDGEIQRMGFSFFPREWSGQNYLSLLANNVATPILRWFMNSLVIAVSHTLLVLTVVSLAAYGYARLEFRGRDALFFILLSTMMFPNIINLIPNYKILDAIGWTNTFMAVILPGAAGVFNVFLVRQFVLNIPKELDEAAVMEGANELQIFYYVILPLIKPILVVVAVFSFTGSWNDFLWPSIVMSDIDMLPITPGLQLLQGQYMGYPGIAIAGSLLALLPTFILFLVAQKYFMQSMDLQSGIK